MNYCQKIGKQNQKAGDRGLLFYGEHPKSRQAFRFMPEKILINK
jgi:hypothetical protein